MTHKMTCCGMMRNAGSETETECGEEAVAEVEGGPACASCRAACQEEGLEILPLGTETLYSAGKTAFDHAKQYDHNTAADCVIKAVAAMLALNKSGREF